MSDLITTDTQRLILGLGKTGYSMAAWLSAQGKSFRVMDTRAEPPYGEAALTLCGQDRVHLGSWQADWLAGADELYVSPGLALAEPQIQQALARGAVLVSDIDLYRQNSQATLIAVTGSNGKSTVVTLLEHIAQGLGIAAFAGGNIGTPVLELLAREHDVAILELSSFQLEMTHQLAADVAMVLNVSPDHMDRYPDLMSYRAAKHRIFSGCRGVVYHADDAMTQPLMSEQMPRGAYSLSRQDLKLLSIRADAKGVHLTDGPNLLYTWKTLRLKGQHNLLNVLAALSAA
ncbi:MAG: Mur ligase family protein, partial [Natronospirillum sp.]